jgi:hypothetical protein
MAISLEERREIEPESNRASWNGIFDSAMRLLPLLGAALPGTLLVAYSYALGYSDYFRIPMEFIRVSPMQATIPFGYAYLIVSLLLRLAQQVQMFGPWPAITKNVARIRGSFLLLLVASGVAGRLRGEFPWSTVIIGIVTMWLMLWGLPALMRFIGRFIARRTAVHGRLAEWLLRFVLRPIGLGLAAIWRHLFGRTPTLRGSRVSRWSVTESVLVMAVGLLIALPYFIGAGHARIQSVYGIVGHAASQESKEKDVVVTIYGEKVFVAHVDGRTLRSIEVRNFSDLKDVAVRKKDIGRLHW